MTQTLTTIPIGFGMAKGSSEQSLAGQLRAAGRETISWNRVKAHVDKINRQRRPNWQTKALCLTMTNIWLFDRMTIN